MVSIRTLLAPKKLFMLYNTIYMNYKCLRVGVTTSSPKEKIKVYGKGDDYEEESQY